MAAQQTTSGRRRHAAESPKWEIQVSLFVRGFDSPPDEITKITGLKPTRTWLRGDSIPPSTLAHKDNAWVLDSPARKSESLQTQVEKLFLRISSAWPKFSTLPSNARVELFCVVYDYDRAVVLEFPVQVIRDLAAIGASIGIDYYDMSESKD